MVSLPDQPVSISKVLDNGVSLFTASFMKIVPIAILGSFITTFLTVRYINDMPQPNGSSPEEMAAFMANLPVLGIVWLGLMLVGMLMLGAIIFRIGNTANTQQDSFGQAIGVGLKKLIPLFIAMILYLIAFMIGTVLLIIPGLYLFLSLSFFTYFMVNENEGLFTSLKLSHRLIKGNWWRTATVYLAPTLVMIALIGGTTFIAAATGNVTANGQPNGIFAIISGAINAVLYPLMYCVGYAQFHDLKLRKSGSDLEARLQEQTASA